MKTATRKHVKVSVNLPLEAVNALKRMAEERGLTKTEILRQSLLNEEFLRNEIGQGTEIILQSPGGARRQLVLRG